MTLAQLIVPFVRRHALAYGGSALMLACIASLTVWLPRQVGHLVDLLVAGGSAVDALWREVALLAAAGVMIYGFRVAWRLILYATTYRMGVQLRLALFARLGEQGPSFYGGRRTGDLMALATNDVDAIELAGGEAVLAAFDGTLTFILVVTTMAAFVDWRLALVALLPFPFLAFAFWRISVQLHLHSRQALDTFGALNDHVQESLAGVRAVRALGLESANAQRFSGLAKSAADASFEAQRWEALYEPAVGTSLSVAATASIALGGWLVWHDEITIGQLTSFGLYLGQLVWPMYATGTVLSLWERGRAAWDRLSAVLEQPLAVQDEGGVATVTPGEIGFDGVTFAYPAGNRPAIDSLTLTIEPGTTVGIVGPTGSGKSTLLALLMRQWDPQGGRVRLNGVPLTNYRLDALRAASAWVPQEPALFSTTVAENIALARPSASREEIIAAALAAEVDEDIRRLPEGYDTVVGERGVTLSGGQRQRIALARALLSEAPLLLLDDALSAVDSDTQHRILEHLRAGRVGRTALIVSHRLSTVADADRIFVLRHGQVHEAGSHAELLARDARDSWYAKQWRVQQLEASLDAD
jgi:ATP-binding cassette subfamily B protein/ATP-binding cassette subfamily C protein/ATP-binding cassette subfamily B multidrug efflux pump